MSYHVKGKWGDQEVDLKVTSVDDVVPTPPVEPPTDPVEPPEEPPVVEPGPDPVPEPGRTKKAWAGEVVYLYGQCAAGPFKKTSYKAHDVETLQPSWKGARVGKYPIILEETESRSDMYVNRIEIPRVMEPGTYPIEVEDEPFSIVVEDKVMPKFPMMPMYMELQSRACRLVLEKITGDPSWNLQPSITQKYIDMLRSFWIEPTKQGINHYPTDPTTDVWGGTAGSYEALVFDGAIAEPLLWAGDPWKHPPKEFLQWVQASKYDAMFWGMDEAGTGPSGATLEMALDRIRWLNTYASYHRVLQTGKPHPQYLALEKELGEGGNAYIIRSIPNVWVEKHRDEFEAMYGSCMSVGNCQNTTDPDDRTIYPVHVIEGDPDDDWYASVIFAHIKKAEHYMHFSATKKLLNVWEPGGCYDEGGNWDGTQIAHHPETGDPLPTMMLVKYHEALQEVTKRRLA